MGTSWVGTGAARSSAGATPALTVQRRDQTLRRLRLIGHTSRRSRSVALIVPTGPSVVHITGGDSMVSSSAARPGPETTDAGDDREPLADQLASLARALEQEHDPPHTLEAIVRGAVETVPGASHASISVVRSRRVVVTEAATGDLPRRSDQAQYDTGEGPSLDTLYQQETVRVADMEREPRWPEFTARAVGLGVGSMLVLQLYVAGDDLGALNLFSEQRDAFDRESEHVGLLFASHAAVALSSAQRLDHLKRGMDTRDLIGQAKGVLMERLGVTGDQAFGLLVRASQSRNRKLSDIAAEITTGTADRQRGAATAPPGPRGGVRPRA